MPLNCGLSGFRPIADLGRSVKKEIVRCIHRSIPLGSRMSSQGGRQWGMRVRTLPTVLV